MIKNQKISLFQFGALIISFILGTSILVCPEVYLAGRSGWVADFLGVFFSFITVIIIILLHYPSYNKNIVEIAANFGGNILKNILAALYFLYAVHLGALNIRIIGDFLASTIMLNMPIIISTSALTLVAAYGIVMGIQTIGRVGQVLFPVIVSIFLLFIFLAIPEYQPRNLLPFTVNIKEILRGGFFVWTFPFGNLILFTFLIPYVRVKEKDKKSRLYLIYLLAAVIISGGILALRTLALTMVMGSNLTESFTYPVFSLVGVIEIGNFLERLEPAFLIMWIGASFINILISFWVAVENILIISSEDDVNSIILPVGIIMVAFAQFIFQNYSEQYGFVLYTWPFYSFIFIFVIPVFILIVNRMHNANK